MWVNFFGYILGNSAKICNLLVLTNENVFLLSVHSIFEERAKEMYISLLSKSRVFPYNINFDPIIDGNYTRMLEQIQEVISNKTAPILSPASHLTNHSNQTNKTCGTLLEKQGWTHKQSSLMNSCTWKCQCWPTSKDLHQLCADTRCNLEDLPGVMDDRDGWQERARELHAISVTWWW